MTAVILVALGVLVAVLGVALTPTRRRRAVAPGYVAAGVLLAAAGAVFALVAAGAVLATVDVAVLDRMVARRSAGASALAEGLALFGGTAFTGGAAVVTALVLAVRGRWVWAWCWVAAVAIGASAVRLLKLTVERPRPPELTRLAQETTTSLPSGHALMSALGLGLTASAIVLLNRDARPVLRWLAAVLAVVLAAAIGASRAYLGVHWATDVVAGWLFGAALAALATTVARDRQPVGPRRGARRPGAGADGDEGAGPSDRHVTSPDRGDAP